MNNILSLLSTLEYFRISHIDAYVPHIKRASLYQKISRWIKDGKIIKLKKGFYVTREYYGKHSTDQNYIYYLANLLRYPSYVSCSYLLQNHDILTDVIYPITSITTKSTRQYSNKIGNFIYYSISPKLYTGFNRFYYLNEPIYVASKGKALFDFLYLKYFNTKSNVKEIIERERLNLENFTKKEAKEFAKYCKLSKIPILIELNLGLF